MPAVKWVKAKCEVCGGQFEYAEGGYEPKTCGRFECVQKHLHPELQRGLGDRRSNDGTGEG